MLNDEQRKKSSSTIWVDKNKSGRQYPNFPEYQIDKQEDSHKLRHFHIHDGITKNKEQSVEYIKAYENCITEQCFI